jgi:hypothetical protein
MFTAVLILLMVHQSALASAESASGEDTDSSKPSGMSFTLSKAREA